MALGVAGTFKDPKKRKQVDIVSVEIAAGCNIACPGCLTGDRRFYTGVEKEEKKRYARSKDLNNLLTQYFPSGSVPIFIGLGEPMLEQKAIAQFMHHRPDIKTSHIQTNGGVALNSDLIRLVEDKRVSIGVSYDTMHRLGGQKNYTELAIQPEYVSGIATAIEPDDEVITGFNYFPNLDRILVHPTIDEKNKFKISWPRLKEAIRKYTRQYPHQSVYTDLSDFFEATNREFYAHANNELKKQPGQDWKHHETQDFYAYAPPLETGIRLLINGTYTTKPEESAHTTWETLKESSHPIEQLAKQSLD